MTIRYKVVARRTINNTYNDFEILSDIIYEECPSKNVFLNVGLGADAYTITKIQTFDYEGASDFCYAEYIVFYRPDSGDFCTIRNSSGVSLYFKDLEEQNKKALAKLLEEL